MDKGHLWTRDNFAGLVQILGTVNQHSAFVRDMQSTQCFYQGGLASTVLTEQSDYLAALNVQ